MPAVPCCRIPRDRTVTHHHHGHPAAAGVPAATSRPLPVPGQPQTRGQSRARGQDPRRHRAGWGPRHRSPCPRAPRGCLRSPFPSRRRAAGGADRPGPPPPARGPRDAALTVAGPCRAGRSAHGCGRALPALNAPGAGGRLLKPGGGAKPWGGGDISPNASPLAEAVGGGGWGAGLPRRLRPLLTWGPARGRPRDPRGPPGTSRDPRTPGAAGGGAGAAPPAPPGPGAPVAPSSPPVPPCPPAMGDPNAPAEPWCPPPQTPNPVPGGR